MLTIGKRIAVARKKGGYTQESLADELGMSRRTLIRYENNESPPSAEFIINLEKIGLDFSYVLLGEKALNLVPDPVTEHIAITPLIPMPEENFNADNETLTLHESSVTELSHDLVSIPQLDIAFSGGHGQYPDDHPLVLGSRSFSAEWIKKKGLNPNQLSLVRLHGDSMEGKIPNHSILMLDRTKTRPTPSLPVAFRLDNELYVKNYQSTGKRSEMAFHSTNPAYPPIIIDSSEPPEDFEIIGAVVWHAVSWI